MTDFRYLRNIWKKNTEEEALLGVSMTGIMDCKLTNGSTGEEALGRLLETLRDVAILTNKDWAQEARS
jgi:ribonucleoside-triphosphate reductase (thioredoxin)